MAVKAASANLSPAHSRAGKEAVSEQGYQRASHAMLKLLQRKGEKEGVGYTDV